MKPSIKKYYQRCSHGWVMDEWWEIRVNGHSLECGTFQAAIQELEKMYKRGWVKLR